MRSQKYRSVAQHAATMFFPHFVGDVRSRSLVETTPHLRRGGAHSAPNESRE
jgi:hypothetical protein